MTKGAAPAPQRASAPKTQKPSQAAGERTTAPVKPAAQSPLSSALALGGKSLGTPLDAATRRAMEARLGRDVGDVRVHDGPDANAAARAVDARAFTVGRSIYFAAGEYAPQSGDGRRLLAHELVHAEQQRDAPGARPRDPENDALETEAARVAASAERPAKISRAPAQHVARQPRDAKAADEPPPDWAAIAERLRSADDTVASIAFYDIRGRVLSWDSYAIAIAMLGLRADGKGATWAVMRALDRLAKQDATRFRTVLRDLRAGYESVHSATIRRGDDDITITPPQGASVESVRQLDDVLGGLVYVAQQMPEARPVAAEWERSAQGLASVAARLHALGDARGALVSYLQVPLGHGAYASGTPQATPAAPAAPAGTTPRFERTDPAVMNALRATSSRLLRYQALTLVQSHASGQSDFAYALEGDLVENVRLVDATLVVVQRVDQMLQGLAQFYGAAVDRLEEAKVLRELRGDVLYDLAASALPVAESATKRREVMAARLGDWIGTTADRRLATLRAGVGKMIDAVYQLPGAPSPSAKGLPQNAALLAAVGEYGMELTELHGRLRQLKDEIAIDWSGPRDATYLAAVNAFEQRAGVAAASVPVLNMWGAGIRIYLDLMRGDVGDADDKAEWIATIMKLRDGAADLLKTKDFARLERWVFQWQQDLYKLVDQIRDVRRQENNRRILLAIGALIATAATGGALSGLGASALTITLGEAAAFTVVSTVVTPLALGRSVSGVDVVKEFAKTAATFGVFHVLNVGILAGARLLVPQQAFAQFSIVFGGQLVAATGVGALIEYLEHGALPSDLTTFLVSSLVLTTLGSLFGAPELMRQLQQGSGPLVSELHTKIMAIRAEANAIQELMRDPIVSGRLTKPQFELVKAREVALSEEMATALRRLAARDIRADQRASLGLPEDATTLLRFAEMSESYGLAARARQYPERGAGPPAPDEVVGEAIVVANGRYEYNPNMPATTPGALATRFRNAGYLVTNEAGVLRLMLPGESTPRHLLLPAGHSMPAPALARLVTPPGPDAADVLRRSQTNAAKGLRMLQAQTAVPSLEGTLTRLATAEPDAVRALLVGLGRHVAATDAAALIGVAHALDLGGAPGTLAVVMGLGNEVGAAQVRQALRRLTTLGTPEFAGLDAIVRLRGDVRSATDRIAGILTQHAEPEAVLRSLGVLEPRTDRGLDQLVRSTASRDAGVRRQADDALRAGMELVVRSPTTHLRFERATVGGAQVLTVRDASVTTSKALRSYTPAELDHLVATTADIVQIRTLGEGMVQGSAGALFEKWAWRYVLSPQSGITPVARLRVMQADNAHIHLLAAEGRSSDAFLAKPGPPSARAQPGVTDIDVWDMKFYRTGGHVDDEQIADYQAMRKAGLVVNAADRQRYRIRFVNYLFESEASALANAHVADSGATVWYVSDTGVLTLSR